MYDHNNQTLLKQMRLRRNRYESTAEPVTTSGIGTIPRRAVISAPHAQMSATGIIAFSHVAIATSTDAEELMDHVEGLLFAIGQTQIQVSSSVFAALLN